MDRKPRYSTALSSISRGTVSRLQKPQHTAAWFHAGVTRSRVVVPLKLARATKDSRKEHEDAQFTFATCRSLKHAEKFRYMPKNTFAATKKWHFFLRSKKAPQAKILTFFPS